MKKIFFAACLLFVLLLSSCSGQYLRISFQGESLGTDESLKKIRGAEVVYSAKETFGDTFSVYKITPHQISMNDFKELAKCFDVNEEPEKHIGAFFIRSKELYKGKACKKFILREPNEISISFHDSTWRAYDWTEEQTERVAREFFQRISLLKGDYEYLGISSTQTAYKDDDHSFVNSVRVSFRRLLDGTRVIGNDICDMYFDGNGVTDIELKLFDYEKIGEMDFVPLEDAKERIKKPDSFSMPSDEKTPAIDECDTLEIERVKLLFVNQYSQGCEILQPVYNFIGKMKNETQSAEFQSRVIAIPEKYTHN